jgi:YD repeat-containing protein
VGNVIAATNARGKLTRFEYDARDRMRRMIDPYGNADEMQYSAQG